MDSEAIGDPRSPARTDDEQAALWNGGYGRSWVKAQDLLNKLFKPLEDLLADVAQPGHRALDVGCGTGATTLAVARRLGAAGSCTGIDLSAPMIAAAQERAKREGVPAQFVRADAQTHRFDDASFDFVFSRFGVMFFADSVAAFANLRRAAGEEAELRFIVWRAPEENPFMTAAERAAAPLLPDLPTRQPKAPGPFAFAEVERVRTTLAESGWSAVDVQPLDALCTMPASRLDDWLGRVGPVGRALLEADEPTRRRVIESLRPAFDRYVHGEEIRFRAACWMVGASSRPAAGSTRG